MKKIIALIFLVTFMSCDKVEVNCESGNHSALLDKAKSFIEKNMSSDSKTKDMSLSNYKFIAPSCEANIREKTVSFRLNVTIRESNKDRSTGFRCQYLGKEDKIRCQMI